MSRSDARIADTRSPSPGRDWGAALKRDAREFAGVAEYEFRKLVGASRTQRQPGLAKADGYERRPLGGRKPKTISGAEPDAGRARQDKPDAALQASRKVDRPAEE